MITVVLNCYKRQQALRSQIRAVLAQSVPVERILVWNNGESLDHTGLDGSVVVANCSKNLGVWSRFAFALNSETEYVCILDDDTFPGRDFFKSCLDQMAIRPALYGARGLRFLTRSRYQPFQGFGWDSPNEESEEVDIVGHAWFFKRDWLGVFWRELPNIGSSRVVGEDMHFSFMLREYLDVPTFVPPHPIHNQRVWGSDPSIALQLGTSREAISQSSDALDQFDRALRFYTDRGFQLWKDKSNASNSAIALGPGISRYPAIKDRIRRYPWLERMCRKGQKWLARWNIYI